VGGARVTHQPLYMWTANDLRDVSRQHHTAGPPRGLFHLKRFGER
jgi:hypothetical protein